jgi:hypothetical protein
MEARRYRAEWRHGLCSPIQFRLEVLLLFLLFILLCLALG